MKELEKMKVKIRSQYANREVIKVVYIGNLAGFHFGKVIEAKARYAKSSGRQHPYPKHMHCEYQIIDEDGDTFPVSENGTSFYKDFYPVPDHFELGDLI